MTDEPDGPETIERVLNAIDRGSDAEILLHLVRHGPSTSTELIRETGLSHPTIYRRMEALRETDAIIQFEDARSGKGRNPVMYDVADTATRTRRTGDLQVPPEAADLPPSAKVVSVILRHNQPATQKEIVEAANMSQRTVRDALERLDPYIRTEPNFDDARQTLYRYDPTGADESEDEETDEAGVSVPYRPGELGSK